MTEGGEVQVGVTCAKVLRQEHPCVCRTAEACAAGKERGSMCGTRGQREVTRREPLRIYESRSSLTRFRFSRVAAFIVKNSAKRVEDRGTSDAILETTP